MRHLVLRMSVLCVLALFSLAARAQIQPLDVQDVSILFPPPNTVDDVAALVSMSEPTDGGEGRLVPQAALDALLQSALSTKVASSAGVEFGINFGSATTDLRRPELWKLVAVRIDPSAPGSHASVVSQFGSTAQIRLVFQPVIVSGGAIKVLDVTAHVAYSFIDTIDPETRIVVPNQEVFSAIVQDFLQLRATANAAGINTAGPLGVHPALKRQVSEFSFALRGVLKHRLPQGRLTEMAFMGVDSVEPWIFFPMLRLRDGSFVQVPLPTLGGAVAQMLTFRGGNTVMPAPQTKNVDGTSGVSTAPLFSLRSDNLQIPVSLVLSHVTHSDIPDIIANPQRSTVRNTDCVSCHTESTRRNSLHAVAHDPSISYRRPDGISGVDPAMLPRDQWNVRNFGWFQTGGVTQPTVTMRTANETAEAVGFINREYLKLESTSKVTTGPISEGTPIVTRPVPVASPLNLVMTTRPDKIEELKVLLGKMQALPADQNPVARALASLAMVHFAQFAFLNDRQLAVITTYDGSFEKYIDAFVDSVGTVFDQLLAHMEGAPPLPVSEHRQEFLDYVRRNNIEPVGTLYSAYPQLKVLDILTLEKEHQK